VLLLLRRLLRKPACCIRWQLLRRPELCQPAALAAASLTDTCRRRCCGCGRTIACARPSPGDQRCRACCSASHTSANPLLIRAV
jgi:hypothetical protein